ncbi:hypothetical protein Q7P35_005688 [Cladosporium inversicolor]
MASMPQRQPPPQHQSSPDETSSPQPQPPVLTRSANSEDSQVVILDHNEAAPTDEQPQLQQQAPLPKPSADDPDSDIKKCWICFSDSNEDTPETSPWRDPCPCALVAHEECLLDWIADAENTKNTNNRSFGPPQITCPQCKSEIKLARPRNYIVDVAKGLERLGSRLVWPSALSLLGGLIVQGNFALGVHTIYRIFGAQDGYRILQPLLQQMVSPPLDFDSPPRLIAATVLYKIAQHARHWRLYVGVPLITPLLVLSRTSLADSVLPALPVLFLATQAHSSGEILDFTAWPPSASMAFAVLPYLRSAYNAYFERVWAKKERQWIREVQPRAESQDDTGDQADAEAGQAAAAADEDNIFEVRIDGGIWDDWEGNNDIDNIPAEAQAPAVPGNDGNLPQDQGDDVAAPPPNIADNHPAPQPAGAPAQAQPQAQQNERRLAFSTTTVAETVLGALAFPTIAELSGEVLRLALPSAWTMSEAAISGTSVAAGGLLGALGLRTFSGPTALRSSRGLLQEKWGRSLVGGCLFVVLKDAVMLYTRWRSARMHKERRVLDFQRKKAKA